jgi:hypothetical protein
VEILEFYTVYNEYTIYSSSCFEILAYTNIITLSSNIYIENTLVN